MKIALALIIKDDKDEAVLLDRLLQNMAPYMDGLFVTGSYKTKPQGHVKRVCEKHGAIYSEFKWVDDFAAARNFSFAQVPKDFDYVMWSDADDQWSGLEKLRDTIETNPKDGYSFWYLYDFDEYNQPTVAHKKTMIIRNDGCAKWVGMIHEDLMPQRETQVFFIEGIKRMHLSTEDRHLESAIRNERIAKKELKLKGNTDPHYVWNYGNALLSLGKWKEVVTLFKKFLKDSGSDQEKYLVRMRLSSAYENLGKIDEAEEQLLLALGEKPNIPDAYLQLGYFYLNHKQYDKSEFYFLQGIKKKPAYHQMIVFNPRDYDYNPMMAMANLYFRKSRPDLALPVLEGCLQIYPDNAYVKGLVEEMKKEKEILDGALEIVKKIEAEPDMEKKKAIIESVPDKLKPHPAICMYRNKFTFKTESSGKDIAYYCGETTHEWNPILFKKKGFGGSEEAVVNLSREWARQGYNVTVFNSCGPEIIKEDGVTYKPWWMFNPNDKYDTIIMWRSPRLCDHNLKADKILIDLHDVIAPGEFTEKRLAKIHKIMVKSQAHRVLFPNVPDEKFEIVQNGMDVNMFTEDIKREQYLMVNTSSPDRSMDVLPKLFKMVKTRVPEARLAWCYGWEIWDNSFPGDKKRMAFKESVIKEMEEAGIEVLGRLPQHEAAKWYQRANVLAYPTEFYEIDCISARKAQLAGCIPVTTDFAALAETNANGIKVRSPKNKDNWSLPYQLSFGLTDKKAQEEWVDKCVEVLQQSIGDRSDMIKWAKEFNWTNISNRWLAIIK